MDDIINRPVMILLLEKLNKSLENYYKLFRFFATNYLKESPLISNEELLFKFLNEEGFRNKILYIVLNAPIDRKNGEAYYNKLNQLYNYLIQRYNQNYNSLFQEYIDSMTPIETSLFLEDETRLESPPLKSARRTLSFTPKEKLLPKPYLFKSKKYSFDESSSSESSDETLDEALDVSTKSYETPNRNFKNMLSFSPEKIGLEDNDELVEVEKEKLRLKRDEPELKFKKLVISKRPKETAVKRSEYDIKEFLEKKYAPNQESSISIEEIKQLLELDD